MWALTMKLHTVLLARKSFCDHFEEKLIEFDRQGMYTCTYIKQIASYKQKKNINLGSCIYSSE